MPDSIKSIEEILEKYKDDIKRLHHAIQYNDLKLTADEILEKEDVKRAEATQAINKELLKARKQLLKDLNNCGEIHHSVYDYRIEELEAQLKQSQTEGGE